MKLATATGSGTLAGDLGRGGYLRGAYSGNGDADGRWFQTELVLTRPGILARCAELLRAALPADADRLAARGSTAVTLATATGLAAGIPLLVGEEAAAEPEQDGSRFQGEPFPGARTVLIEDVLLTGVHATTSVAALRALGVEVIKIVCLLDREAGGRYRLEAAGTDVAAAFTERELL